MFAEWAIGKALDLAFDKTKQYLRDTKTLLACAKQDVETKLAIHQQGVQSWCEEISFADLGRARSTTNVYVGLSVFVLPRALRIESEETVESQTLETTLADSCEHLVLLGQPGAGKTTSMKYLCYRLQHDESFLPDGPSFPLVLRLRDLNLSTHRSPSNKEGGVIFPAIAKIFGLKFRSSTDAAFHKVAEELSEIETSIALLFLDEFKPLLVLDGFDELASRKRRDIAIQEIRDLTRQLRNARVLLTSRTGEFRYQIGNATTYEICPLSEPQIEDFAHKWLGDSSRAMRFIGEISHSPFSDTTIKPLTLAHLCAIYDRLGRIPDKPKTVYRKVVNLLIEEWDEQRSVRRQSRYAGFSPDRKFDFLCRLAYELTLSGRGSTFRVHDLRKTYSRLCRDFDLLPKETKQILEELESHTGLFVQAGYEGYEFVHRSLQEYLTAEYIKGLPSLPSASGLIRRLPNELAIAVAISTNPSRYLIELVMSRIRQISLPNDFFTTFVSRLLQEKPEFNAEEEVILALLVLYATYLGGVPRKGQQLQLFIFDDLATQFELLLNALVKRNKRGQMFRYYSKVGVIPTGEPKPLVVLEKRKEADKFQLPDRLYAREQFFESLSH